LGKAEEITDLSQKEGILKTLVEHIMPGRWADVRKSTTAEMKATRVFGLSWHEASAKIREGFPMDDPTDHAVPVWAGILPLGLSPGTPEQDPQQVSLSVPEYILRYQRRVGGGR
jgi:hypothetical protein